VDNIKERNRRLGPPCKTRAVRAYVPGVGTFIYPSQLEAALSFGINQKTVWNRLHKRTIKTNNGPRNLSRDVVFSWA